MSGFRPCANVRLWRPPYLQPLCGLISGIQTSRTRTRGGERVPTAALWTLCPEAIKLSGFAGERGGAVMTVRTARCACGACWVDVEGEPVSSGLCSCDNCKRRTGAPFGWSLYFRDEQVRRIAGPLSVLVGVGKRWFCSACGSTIYWRSFGAWRPGQTGFAGGCFADPTLPPPSIAVRCAQAMPWIGYPADCALYDDMPPSPQTTSS